MIHIIDAAAGHDGAIHLLTADGSIYRQAKPNDIALQHVPPSRRPEFVWEKLNGPAGDVTKLIIKGHGELWAISDGALHRRIPLTFDEQQQRGLPGGFIWRSVGIDEQ